MVILAASRLTGPDYFILTGYFVLMLGIGAYFYKYMKGMRDYFTGGNRIPWWLSGVSFYMSCFSAFGFIAYSELAYKYGLVSITIWWFGIPAFILSVLLFGRRWRRMRITSPVEYLENRYSTMTRQLFAWEGLPVRIIDDALKIVAIGIFVSRAFDVSLTSGMMWSGLIMLSYTMMGGLWAVVVTDFIQFIIMLVAIIILVPLALYRVGGLENFFHNSPEGFFRMTNHEYDWFYVLISTVLSILGFSAVNWSLIQRYYCVPKEKDVYKLAGIVIVLEIIIPPLILFPAMAARQFMPNADPEQVYPLLCLDLLPVGMVGLIIAAMFSATMSMLSSDYNAAASVLTNDIYKRIIRPRADEKELVFVARVATCIIGLLTMGIALMMTYNTSGGNQGDTLFRNMMKLFSLATAPVGIPMVAGIMFRRINNKAALSGFMAGITAGLVTFFLGDMIESRFTSLKLENVLLIVTILSTSITMFVTAKLFPVKESEQKRITEFLKRIEIPIGQLAEDPRAPVKGEKVFSPFFIVGVSIIIIALMLLAVLWYIQDQMAFYVNLCLSVLMLIMGFWMAWFSRYSRKKSEMLMESSAGHKQD